METHLCKCCGRELPITNFKKTRWGGHTSVCLDCDITHRKEKKQQRLDDAAKKIENEKSERRKMCISDFTPRELMEELARRGYEGTLRFTRIEEIDITNF